MAAVPFALLAHFVRRDIESRYLGSISGFAWALIQPLALLAVYAWVFVGIFRAQVPEAAEVGFVVFLAIGFWPWLAFAESIQRAATVIPDHAALIGKVALPHWVLVAASVTASFLIHLLGYALVLLVMALIGKPLHWLWLPGLLPYLLILFTMAMGLAFAAAAIQVFIRDLSQALGPIFTLWFFLSPILYSISLIPERIRPIAELNPLARLVEAARNMLIEGEWAYATGDLILAALAVFCLASGFWLFQRLHRHFEDFL